MNLQDRALLPEEMRHTYSVCPVCLKRIPAKREERDGQIYLVKTCPDHGTFSSVIWRNSLPTGAGNVRRWEKMKI